MSGKREKPGFQFWLNDDQEPSEIIDITASSEEKREIVEPQPNQSWLFRNQGQRVLSASEQRSKTAGKKPGKRRRNVTDTDDIQRDTAFDTNAKRDQTLLELESALKATRVDKESRQSRRLPSRTPSRTSEYSEFALTSYDSCVFEPDEFRTEAEMKNNQETPKPTESEIDRDIEQMRQDITQNAATTADAMTQGSERTDAIMEFVREIRQQLAGMQEQFHEQIENIRGQQQEWQRQLLAMPSQCEVSAPLTTRRVTDNADVAYGRGVSDIRNRPIAMNGYIQLKEARSLIPEVDGTSQAKIQEFLSASTYAIESIDPIEEPQLLKAILCTKLKGKILLDFQTKDIQTFVQLKREIEAGYTTHKSVTHLQIEFNTLRQKLGENAQAYGTRVDQLAMKLYEAMIDGKSHTIMEKNTIKTTIQSLALQNYQIGLHESIKTIVRARNYRTLQEAIAVATAEEKLQSPYSENRNSNKFRNSMREKVLRCTNCGKLGHDGRDCKTGRYHNYNNRYQLPRASGPKVNAMDIFCKHCKKSGHNQDTCWSLHGKPDRDNARPRKNAKQGEEEGANMKEARSARASQIASVGEYTQANLNLDLIAVPMREIQAARVVMLVDTGAALTLIKLKNLKGETLVYDEKTTIVGATGQKAETLGTIMAHVPLKERIITHKMHVIKDNFPISYDGILGADFLKKYVTKWDYPTKQLIIGGNNFKLFPCKQVTLKSRSETIVSATTNKNVTGIVHALEIQPGIIMGGCMTTAQDYGCVISIINTTDKPVDMQTPHVEITPMEAETDAQILSIEINEVTNKSMSRTEKIKSSLRIEHLNEEERKAIIRICEEYSDIFHVEGEPLTHTGAMKHEITTRPGTAPANTRPYRLPEKHKEEVSRQVQEMLKNKIVRPSTSQWNAPLLVVPKKTDASGKPKMRVVVDFRKLNNLTIGDSFPLPNITDILDQLGSSKYFTTLDLASGYHQISMAEDDKEKTAFSTPYGHYEFNRMPFGLKNAPATFQRLMNTILTGLQGIKCLVYLDDIVIYGASLTEHNQRLKEVLNRIRANNLKLQPDKCEFLRKEVTYLGHIITENGIMPDAGKVKAVQDFPTPNKLKDIQAFIGLAGYYQREIH